MLQQRYSDYIPYLYAKLYMLHFNELGTTDSAALAACVAQFEEEEFEAHLCTKLYKGDYILYFNAQSVEIAIFDTQELVALLKQ